MIAVHNSVSPSMLLDAFILFALVLVSESRFLMTSPERSDHPLRVALARHRVGRLASNQLPGRPSWPFSIMHRPTLSGRHLGLHRVPTDVLTPIQVGTSSSVWRRTTDANQTSILYRNQTLRGPTPDPSDASLDALLMAFDATRPGSSAHQIQGHQSSGSGATAPDCTERTLTLGARQTLPSPRLVSLPIRSVRDEIVRSFVGWAQANGHIGERIRHDVWHLALHYADQSGHLLAPENQFFEALARVEGVERLHDRPVHGPTGYQTLTTYHLYTQLEVAAIREGQTRSGRSRRTRRRF
jgi:hypothetical protein